ncbi:leucine-rich repeat domain-containing protein [Streptomyces xylophagus]|uniref:leucine-rich repeat domain-containing protein n=1 Tax=Streptomyces xylophagus TaxID=285514 RepID=UPI000B05FED6|nr:leucine-rich repeat domain-containing protein [Streptomyces xylophagus]
MTTTTSPTGYRVITVEEAEERFGVSADVSHPYQDFADEQEIRLYEGGLTVAGGLEAEPDGDWVPYNTIVDGDLTVGGDVEWWDSQSGNFLLVTGDLRARHVLLSGCPSVVVRGDVSISGVIQGSYGDDGGFLTVGGRTRAEAVISSLYFNMDFAGQPEALLIADPHRTSHPVDFTDEELDDLVLPGLLAKDETADERAISAALRAGQPVLRPGIRPSHLLALDELDALLPRAAEVTELDLSDRKLRRFPEQLYAFTNLRVLSLADNDAIGELGERIGELTALEELDVSGTELTGLPESVGRLRNLRVLNISGNAFTTLPEQLGDLPRLEVLRAARLTCPVPEAIARLVTLRELDLSNLQPGEYNSLVAFPTPVTRLPALRSLNLSQVFLETVPDDLLALTALEELDLRGSLSALLPRLPDLARLPRLRVLRLSGRTPWSFQPEPGRELLAGVWEITTLEHLEIDGWGEKTQGGQVVRTAFTALPDDAFARMPGLRRVNLSFNELRTLPESLFALRQLEAADLRHTELDKATVERLRTELGIETTPVVQGR